MLAVRRVPQRVVDRVRDDPQVIVIAVVTVAWVFVMGLNVWRRHDRFDTFDNDLGFHTQYVWLLAHGHWFSSILGLPAFGHNATFGYFLFVPFSWLGGGAQLLDLTQTVAIALGVVPVYVLARRRLGPGWVTGALPIIYLLHPVTQGNVWETFHPEAMAMTPLLCAYVAADGWRWKRFWGFFLLAIIWKTDVALFLAVMGVLFVRRRSPRIGWGSALVAFSWFVLVVAVMIPTLAGGSTVFGPLYGDLGNTPPQVIENSLRHPTRFEQHMRDADVPRYSRDLLTPYGFVPVLAPVSLLIGVPQNMVSLLSDAPFTRDPIDSPHYQALPLVAMTIALIEGLAWLQRHRPPTVEPVVALVLACALATSATWGSLPFSARHEHFWSEDGDPTRPAKEAAVAMPGPDDVVSAQYRLVPHLAERQLIYTFPNPWKKSYYGVEGTAKPDPAIVQWIILDEAVFGDADRALRDCILAAGTFTERMHSQGIIVYERNDHEPTDRSCTY